MDKSLPQRLTHFPIVISQKNDLENHISMMNVLLVVANLPAPILELLRSNPRSDEYVRSGRV